MLHSCGRHQPDHPQGWHTQPSVQVPCACSAAVHSSRARPDAAPTCLLGTGSVSWPRQPPLTVGVCAGAVRGSGAADRDDTSVAHPCGWACPSLHSSSTLPGERDGPFAGPASVLKTAGQQRRAAPGAGAPRSIEHTLLTSDSAPKQVPSTSADKRQPGDSICMSDAHVTMPALRTERAMRTSTYIRYIRSSAGCCALAGRDAPAQQAQPHITVGVPPACTAGACRAR